MRSGELELFREMANHIKALGVKPEIEVFEPGHIMFARTLTKEGLIDGDPMFQLCLGISRFEFDIVAQAASQGGNYRVGLEGLEDNLYLNKSEFTSNVQLVERVVLRIIREIGHEPTTPAQAAHRLGVHRQ
ncbi:MAG: 3-keto-5-aminohexanoate cleavage protein [Gammaproteobacteria bacterium]|nr:3-keto-5-aminohexanoate cleavage protein [Gammaproteobacteria bacterium]